MLRGGRRGGGARVAQKDTERVLRWSAGADSEVTNVDDIDEVLCDTTSRKPLARWRWLLHGSSRRQRKAAARGASMRALQALSEARTLDEDPPSRWKGEAAGSDLAFALEELERLDRLEQRQTTTTTTKRGVQLQQQKRSVDTRPQG